MTTLAFLWRSWIRLLITAEAFGVSVPNVHHAGLSKVNTGSFGTEIPEEIRRIGDELQKAVGGADASMRIDSKVAEVDRILVGSRRDSRQRQVDRGVHPSQSDSLTR